MKETDALIQGYENTEMLRYDESRALPSAVAYDEIGERALSGVLKANYHIDGKLMQTYTEQENHVAVIAATRLGKTTSYVIPTVLSFAAQLRKRSMIISDPKGEIYRFTSETLRGQGYKVVLLNFRDYLHSECWNILTPIFRKYKKIEQTENEIVAVMTQNGARNRFRGKIYDSQSELDEDIFRAKELILGEVGNDIDNLATMFIETSKANDPYWEDSARDVLKAFLWAMLEDSDKDKKNPITENTYSFNTILRIISTFRDGDDIYYNDNGYFTDRPESSRAYMLAKNTLLENGKPTRKCVMGMLMSKLAVFNEVAMRLITSCNSFEIAELAKGPIAVFIDYRDEIRAHYRIISLFVQDAYRFLIETANARPDGKLETPVYFILDEFGNFPALKDFETTISACAGRNVFFILIIQSYAQLNNVYGPSVAEIIKDNLNVHIFFGSNNPETLDAFSRECGLYTRISPLSALNGKSGEIENYNIETIPLVPKSALSRLKTGECIVTEANSGYVLYSKLERYYMCDEFKNLKTARESDYRCSINPFDKRYTYTIPPKEKKRGRFDWNF